MADVFSKRKRSEVMSRIRGRGNKETEVALAKLLRKHGITGWRRQQKLRIEGRKRRAVHLRHGYGGQGPSRPTNVGIDFLFPKARVAVFVDGCFWHGCPKHSNPKKWLGKSSMGERTEDGGRKTEDRRRGYGATSGVSRRGTEARRTGKQFWREKMIANKARDRFVNRELRKQGWRVVRIWKHELGQSRSQETGARRQKVVNRIRAALKGN